MRSKLQDMSFEHLILCRRKNTPGAEVFARGQYERKIRAPVVIRAQNGDRYRLKSGLSFAVSGALLNSKHYAFYVKILRAGVSYAGLLVVESL